MICNEAPAFIRKSIISRLSNLPPSEMKLLSPLKEIEADTGKRPL